MAGLALPLALTQLAQIAQFVTDVVMLGRLGPEVLAGASLGTSLFMPLWLFGVGIVMAVSPIMSQALGARQLRMVRRTVRQGLWVAVAVSLPFGLVLWHGEAILLAFGQEPANAAAAAAYLRAVLWSLPASLCLIVLRSFVSVHDLPRMALVVLLHGIWLNALLNYLLIYGKFGFPKMGLVGAGLATVLVNLFMVALLLGGILLHRKFRRYSLLGRFWRADWSRFVGILKLGMPIGLTIAAESLLFASAAQLMGLIGTNELAGHQIAINCVSVAFMIPLGISQAVTIRIGLAMGRGDPEGVGRAGWAAVTLGLVATTATAAVFWLLPEVLVGFYLGDIGADEVAVAGFAVSFLLVGALFQIFDGAQVVLAGCLRGLKDTRVPMYFAFFSYWAVGFPAGALLAFQAGWGGEGIWYGLMIGLTVVTALSLWRFQTRERYGLVALPEAV